MYVDFQMMKYHRSKWFVFLFTIKTVFSMFEQNRDTVRQSTDA